MPLTDAIFVSLLSLSLCSSHELSLATYLQVWPIQQPRKVSDEQPCGIQLMLKVSVAAALAGSNLMNLFFAIDECTDVQSPQVVRHIADIVMDALKNPDRPRPQGETRLGEVSKQLVQHD